MQTKEYTTIDRTGWPQGDWDGEPDKVQWKDEATGMPCLAVRHSRSGHWCGYVGVSPGHPMFGKDYDAPSVDVHGGLTFADECQGGAEDRGICHLPDEGEPDHVWWFGFDCHHGYDLAPDDLRRYEAGDSLYMPSYEASYKTLRYVKAECRSLASQLKEAA